MESAAIKDTQVLNTCRRPIRKQALGAAAIAIILVASTAAGVAVGPQKKDMFFLGDANLLGSSEGNFSRPQGAGTFPGLLRDTVSNLTQSRQDESFSSLNLQNMVRDASAFLYNKNFNATLGAFSAEYASALSANGFKSPDAVIAQFMQRAFRAPVQLSSSLVSALATGADEVVLHRFPPTGPIEQFADGNLKPHTIQLYGPSGLPGVLNTYQHAIGDCGARSAFVAISDQWPTGVKDLLTGPFNATGSPFYQLRMIDPKGQDVSVTIDSNFATFGDGTLVGTSTSDYVTANWVSVLKKGVMKYNQIFGTGTSDLSSAGGLGGYSPTAVYQAYVPKGKLYGVYTPGQSSYDDDRYDRLLTTISNGLYYRGFITGGFAQPWTGLNGDTVITGHEYFLSGYASIGSQNYISVRNPWGVAPNANFSGGYNTVDSGVTLVPEDVFAALGDVRSVMGQLGAMYTADGAPIVSSAGSLLPVSVSGAIPTLYSPPETTKPHPPAYGGGRSSNDTSSRG